MYNDSFLYLFIKAYVTFYFSFAKYVISDNYFI